MIELQNLTKWYGPTLAVDGISFSIKRGEIVGFLGPNGAGKSTTMKMVTTWLLPTAGTATVAGSDVVNDALEVRKHIGYLPERAPLYDEMQVREYLRFVADIRGLKSTERTAAVDRVVEQCGLQEVFYKNISELSKGYRQRTCLAQSLVHDPDILVLDEPTAGLDPNQIQEIRNLVRELGREKTVVLSTHIMQEVTALCSRVLIITKGRIVADDTPDNLQRRVEGLDRFSLLTKSAEPLLRDAFGAMEGLKLLEVSPHESQYNRVSIECLRQEGRGEEIFERANKSGVKLAEMRRDSFSLEDVFVRLTKADAPADFNPKPDDAPAPAQSAESANA